MWRRIPRAWKWVLSVSTGVPLFLIAVIAFAHTSLGRPLLKYIPGMGTHCPLGYDKPLSPAERDAARSKAMGAVKGEQPAKGRPALGFQLDTMTRQDIADWASDHHLECAPDRSGVACANVPRDVLDSTSSKSASDIAELSFGFDSDGHLVSVRAMVDSFNPEAAMSLVTGVESSLVSEVGPATLTLGERRPEFLRGAMHQASSRYAYSDYFANVSATNVGQSKIHIIEEYQSVPRG